MEGRFLKHNTTNACNVIGIISGMAVILFFAFFVGAGEYHTWHDLFIPGFFACIGLFAVVFCSISFFVNRKVYICINENKISAFCHYGLKLECDLSHVRDVEYGGTGLTIHLSNGKKYNLMNLENATALGIYIQKRIPTQTASAYDIEIWKDEIPSLRKKRKAEGILSLTGFLLLMLYTILVSILDFNAFLPMAGIGAVLIALFCVFLRKCLISTQKLNKLIRRLSHALLQTTPVQSGNPVKLYIADDVNNPVRLTVYGYPDREDVYYILERVNSAFALETVYRSGVYANLRELTPEITDMTEFPLPIEVTADV